MKDGIVLDQDCERRGSGRVLLDLLGSSRVLSTFSNSWTLYLLLLLLELNTSVEIRI